MKPVSLEVTMMKRVGELNKENARLKAEVERLTKQVENLRKSAEINPAQSTHDNEPKA